MKKLVKVLFVTIVTMSLLACSSGTTNNDENISKDNDVSVETRNKVVGTWCNKDVCIILNENGTLGQTDTKWDYDEATRSVGWVIDQNVVRMTYVKFENLGIEYLDYWGAPYFKK